MTHVDLVIDGGNDPGKAQSKEDVDGVAAGDVPDGVIGSLLADGCDLAGEGVREGGAQCYEGDGSDLNRRKMR